MPFMTNVNGIEKNGAGGPAGTSAIAPATAPALNIAVVYEDASCLEWVAEHCHKIAGLIGAENFLPSCWKMAALDDRINFQEAVCVAARADIIMVSLHAAKQLPRRFTAWVNAVLRSRGRPDGALVALVGVPGCPALAPAGVQEHLRIIAWEARLDFFLRELAAAALGGPVVAAKLSVPPRES